VTAPRTFEPIFATGAAKALVSASAISACVKRLWNRTLFERITIKGGQLAGVELKQPSHGVLFGEFK
jgi:hypothetical protein